MVEFEDVQSATQAKSNLHGCDIYSGSCTLKVEFAKTDRLNVKKNDEMTWDFTEEFSMGGGMGGMGGRDNRDRPVLLQEPPQGGHSGGGGFGGHMGGGGNMGNMRGGPSPWAEQGSMGGGYGGGHRGGGDFGGGYDQGPSYGGHGGRGGSMGRGGGGGGDFGGGYDQGP